MKSLADQSPLHVDKADQNRIDIACGTSILKFIECHISATLNSMLHCELFFRGQHQSVPSDERKIQNANTEPDGNTDHPGTIRLVTELIKNGHQRDNNRNAGPMTEGSSQIFSLRPSTASGFTAITGAQL